MLPSSWLDQEMLQKNLVNTSKTRYNIQIIAKRIWLICYQTSDYLQSIYRIVCPNRFKRREKSNKGCGDSSINRTSIIRQSTVYETADDNTGYHELAYISGSSHYDEFQGDYLDPCSM